MGHGHRWSIEPCTQSRERVVGEGIDGELYTPDCRRGNLRGECAGCGARRLFHPFTGGAALYGSIAPAFDLALAVKPSLVVATIIA